MGALYDAPNQQVVRPDGSGPWVEGSGGSTPPDPAPQQAQAQQQEQEPEPEKPQRSGRRRSGSSDVEPAKD